MSMQLIEFKNHKRNLLRGILYNAKGTIGVLFVHGLERNAYEYKFRNIIEALKGRAICFGFDFSGCGLSDGTIQDFTVKKSVKDMEIAIETFRQHAPQVEQLVVVAHSIGAAIALSYIKEFPGVINRLILLAPTLNLRDVLKYHFILEKKADKEISWVNYMQYFAHNEYERAIRNPQRMIRAHTISNKYYMENKDADYQELLNEIDFEKNNILIVHGEDDKRVPIRSNGWIPQSITSIKVKKGDHDLERPDMVKQYLNKVIKFILS